MSTWGGIGEGLTAGMNARIALEEQRRRDAQAQANADRQFEFQREQANRAQANADRTFGAGREDAANAQANADRSFDEGVRRADMAQANADREYALKEDVAAVSADNAARELALKEQAQQWEGAIKNEQLRSFQIANEKLDSEWRKQKEVEDAQKASGRRQLALALYRVTGSNTNQQDIQYKDANGQIQTLKANVLPQDQMRQIFGADGYFKDVQNVVSFKDENGNPVAALIKPDDTMQTFSQDDLYSVYESGVDKAFADGALKKVGEARDLGMFAAKEEAKALANAKATMASDPYGKKRMIDAANAILRDQMSSDEDRAEATKFLRSQIDNQPVATQGRRIEVPASAYTEVKNNGMIMGVRKGTIRMKNGRMLAPGEQIEIPQGTLINDNGTPYIISK